MAHIFRGVGFWWYMEEYTKAALELFGKSIELGIEERKTNINALSKASDVSRTIIYKILEGSDTYSIESYIKLARTLQIHIEFSMMSATNNIHTMTGNKPSEN